MLVPRLRSSGAVALAVVLVASTGAAEPPPDRLEVLESQGEFALAWERASARIAAAGGDSVQGLDVPLLRTALRLLARLGENERALSLVETHARAFDPDERHLVAAALELRSGAARRALAHLEACTFKPGLRGFAAYLEAEALHAAERWLDVLRAAAAPETRALPEEMRRRLRVLEASAALAAGDLARLRRLARGLGPDARAEDRNGLLLVEIARSLLAAGEIAQATEWLLDLLEARPAPAESAFVLLERRVLGGVWRPAPREELRLARYELQRGRSAHARARLLALLDDPRLAREEAASACVALAESYLSEQRDADCLQALRHHAGRFRGTESEPDVLRLKGRALRRLGQEDAAIAVYRELALRFPAHPRADDALYEVGWRYEIRGDFERAEKAYAEVARRFPRDGLADDATLRVGLCQLRAGRHGAALAQFGQMLSRYAGSPLAARALYWSLWIHAARGDTTLVAMLLERLQKESPASYYSFLAAGGVPGASGADVPPAEVGESGLELAERCHATYVAAIDTLRRRARLAAPAAFREASQLWRFCLDHGLADEAFWETRRLELRFAGDPGALLELVAGNHARGAGERLVRLAFLLGQLLPRPELAEPILVLRHPAPLGVTVAESALRHRLSHAAVLAIIRQESAFDPRVDSRAGARGLMQLMPQVGLRLARESGLGELHADALYDPALNVALGCRLFAEELRRAGGRVTQALAAYNAGSEPAAAWSRRLRPEEPQELYLEVAEYLETRQYLEGVLGSLEVYRRLYALH